MDFHKKYLSPLDNSLWIKQLDKQLGFKHQTPTII